jgi:integrase
MGLTVKRIERLSKPGRYADERNLFLQVQASGKGAVTKSWLLRYVSPVTSKERYMGLGPLDTVDLDEARERARKARLAILDGGDPLEQRNAALAARKLESAKRKTFRECAAAWHTENENRWKTVKSWRQALSRLKAYAYPVLGDLSVQALDVGLVLQMLKRDDLWSNKPKTAHRVLQTVRQIVDWAVVNGFRSAGDNPARMDALKPGLPAKNGKGAKKHHASLDYRQIPAFMEELRAREDGDALEFCILCASRAGEVLGARWDEIDGRIWKIPGSRMKGGVEHEVVLSDRALEILASLPRISGNPYCFIGMRGARPAAGALASVVNKMNKARVKAGLPKYVDPLQGGKAVVVHGFRSSFKGFCQVRMAATPDFVSEMMLARTVGNDVRQAYAREKLLEMRARVAETWAQYCLSTPATQGANVVPMKVGAA